MTSKPEHGRVSKNVNVIHDKRLTFGQRMADGMAKFAGSWTFIIAFMSLLIFWILLNSVLLLTRHFDPFPFILLNLILSCLAAIQAPIIMMSQNRQEAKDRIRADHDYEVNLKAEEQIERLHGKIDRLMGTAPGGGTQETAD